jgi:hypothetical protein
VMGLARIRKWFESRKLKSEERYDEEKKEFEMAIGEPIIQLKVTIPEGFEDQRVQFLNLEKDLQFLEEVRDLVKKRLIYEKRGVKPES